MNCEFRKLSIDDGRDVYDLLQELPKDENGFSNGCKGKTYDEFKMWLIKSDNVSKGIGLEEWMVPQSIYWLYVDGVPVGIGKMRHHLTDKLLKEGGHGGYAIHPSRRNKGYGKMLLKMLIDCAKDMTFEDVDFYIKFENNIRVFVYGSIPSTVLFNLRENEFVIFILSDILTESINRNNRYTFIY